MSAPVPTPARKRRLTHMAKSEAARAREAMLLLEKLVGQIDAAVQVLEPKGSQWPEGSTRNMIVIAFTVTPETFDRLVCWHVNGDPEADAEHDGREEDDPPGEAPNEDNAGLQLYGAA